MPWQEEVFLKWEQKWTKEHYLRVCDNLRRSAVRRTGMKSPRSGRWGKRSERISVSCAFCGKEIVRTKYVLSLGKSHCCNKMCQSNFYKKSRMYSLERNPKWNGGVSKLPYSMDWTQDLKDSIRKRDNYKCQKCGAPQEEFTTKLCVHHIDENKKNCDPKNLVSLCIYCHVKLHNGARK